MRELPTVWGDYKHVLKWNIKNDELLGLLLELKNYQEEFRQEKQFESRKTIFVKKGKN